MKNVNEENAAYQLKLTEGTRVWCNFVSRVARTADGFCEFCGSTNHIKVYFSETLGRYVTLGEWAGFEDES